MLNNLFVGVNRVVINAAELYLGAFTKSVPQSHISNCLLCETDFKIEKVLTFTSAKARFQLLSSQVLTTNWL